MVSPGRAGACTVWQTWQTGTTANEPRGWKEFGSELDVAHNSSSRMQLRVCNMGVGVGVGVGVGDLGR